MTAVDPIKVMPPDERTFRTHLARASFQAGVDRGRWRLLSLDWPHATVAVAAALRPTSPSEFHLRFELTNYPQQAPTATPWDQDTDAVLAANKRPRGEIVGFVFRSDWNNGIALYAPFDRLGLKDHQGWVTEHPGHAWTRDRDITFVLGHLHRLLNSDDYLGVAR